MNAEILGAGGYGLVLRASTRALKIFYDTEAVSDVQEEAKIQRHARHLLEGVVSVPEIYTVRGSQISWRGQRYLNGIQMAAVPLVEGFTEQIHILLGYAGPDIDTSWGRNTCLPIGPDNPTRGLFAGPAEMEAIWADVSETKISLSAVAWKMGWATRRLLGAGILPIDLEWIYGGDGQLWLIDFGLCRYGCVADPDEFLYREGSEGLATDIYIPQVGSEHRGSFLLGWHAAMKTWQEIESSTADI
jgi:hypothetical protein